MKTAINTTGGLPPSFISTLHAKFPASENEPNGNSYQEPGDTLSSPEHQPPDKPAEGVSGGYNASSLLNTMYLDIASLDWNYWNDLMDGTDISAFSRTANICKSKTVGSTSKLG